MTEGVEQPGRAGWDRADWPAGPWDAEGDFAAWHDPQTGLSCVLARGGFGAWNGYVAVPAGHPWHGRGYHDLAFVSVHGGLTYADAGVPGADTGRAGLDGDWFLGFDCNHAFDLAPAMVAAARRLGDSNVGRLVGQLTYRDQRYAAAECQRLARQIAAAEATPRGT